MEKCITIKEGLALKIRKSYERWNECNTSGGNDPFYEDGVNMNLIRNHIINYKKLCEQEVDPDDYPEEYLWELPPVVDRKYIANPEEIRIKAKESLKLYEANEDYQYLLKSVNWQDKQQMEETLIINVLGYVRGLRLFLKYDKLVDMRRHKNPETYLEAFRECRRKIEKYQHPETQEKELPTGQLSIFDLYGLTMIG